MSQEVAIDLNRYHYLRRKFEKDPNGFKKIMQTTLKLMDNSLRDQYDEISSKYFKLPFYEVLPELVEAFFDTKGVVDTLPRGSTEYLFSLYKHALHPLHAAMASPKELEDRLTGEKIDFKEQYFSDERNFSIKKWLQSLLFFSYYTNVGDFAKALVLDQATIINSLQETYSYRLIQLQPALNKQKENDILPGTLIPGTGFFDVGMMVNEVESDDCPTCQHPSLHPIKQGLGCLNCKAGYVS